jgi:hypothetical protein
VNSRPILAILLSLVLAGKAAAQVPALLSYQGRVAVGGSAFSGSGSFKFALVNADGSVVFWRNVAAVDSFGVPVSPVTLPVSRGLFSVYLGDTNLSNMAALPVSIFTNSALYLRTWFNDGSAGFQQLNPDQRLAPVGYALMSATVADGAVTLAKLAPEVLATVQPSGSLVGSANPADAGLLGTGYSSAGFIPAPGWANVSVSGEPGPRFDNAYAWTGDSFLIWGGAIAGNNVSGVGALYHPENDTWTPVSTIDAPTARRGAAFAWTGSELILWGGFSSSDYINSGARYNPNSLQWNPLPTSGSPTPRTGAASGWTGSKFIVWGGQSASGILGNGAVLDVAGNSWSALTLTNPPTARTEASSVTANGRLIFWGGLGTGGALNTGSQLVFGTNGVPLQWTSVSTSGAPSARFGHVAVWTGSKMLIWGGEKDGNYLADGASYDPVTDQWQTLPATGAPTARSRAVGVWTGSELLIYGGETGTGETATGAALDLSAGTWRPLNNPGAPVARADGSGVWTGSQLLVFGGQSGGSPLAAGQKVVPQPALYLYRKR